MKSSTINTQQFDLHWRGTLSDYVRAIAFSPDGQTLAASDSAGEVRLWQDSGDLATLQTGTGQSVDCLAFSRDGQFLAAGGQDGQLKIWRLPDGELVATLKHAPAWVDKLAWSPTSNQLAFSLGRDVQVWDADAGLVIATLNFEASSVLGLDWRKDGQYLAIGGYQGVKIWGTSDWDDDPWKMALAGASLELAWSTDSKYLASGNIDRTITVLEWNNSHPWVMRGFPGKIRHLAWSEALTTTGAPLLASCSASGIVVWEKQAVESIGWSGRVLEGHDGVVVAIAFQPETFLLASAAEDGLVCLWHKATRLVQILDGVSSGFSCLAWHSLGHQLAAGGNNGELLVWLKVKRGQGFGQR